jgi:hypothetical protein
LPSIVTESVPDQVVDPSGALTRVPVPWKGGGGLTVAVLRASSKENVVVGAWMERS